VALDLAEAGVTLGMAQLQSASGKPVVSQIDFGTFRRYGEWRRWG
jgi:hypothetical protein